MQVAISIHLQGHSPKTAEDSRLPGEAPRITVPLAEAQPAEALRITVPLAEAQPGKAQPVAALSHESQRIAALSDDDIEALRSIIGAADTSALVPKLYRLAAAIADPGAYFCYLLEHQPDELLSVCLELVCYRQFLDQLATGEQSAWVIAKELERKQRHWLAQLWRERYGGEAPA